MDSFTNYRNLAHRMEDWFWQYGFQREEPYSLPPGKWLFDVARRGRLLDRASDALADPRPTMAIWGPSQTGKSTVISAYIDAAARYEENPEIDGQNSGLHWPGGSPFFFMAPRVADPESLPPHLTSMVLNPFNRGMDGSACLSRFVPGSTEDKPEFHQVTDPNHPVELHLVDMDDLWHALARGYGTECLGRQERAPRPWDLERIRQATSEVLREAEGRSEHPQREAFEDLLKLHDVLDDLASSDDPIFSELSTDREAWQAYLRGLFDEPALLASRTLVHRLAERVLWDGAPAMTQWFRSLAERHESWLGPAGAWKGRAIRCSLEAAALFLNMGASGIAYGPRESNPESPRGIIQDMIGRLGYEIDADTVRISCDPGLPHRLGATADDFSILQGLVWELKVPINMDHLEEHPFTEEPERPNALKEFLAESDILDFPGVGNETKALENRIIVDEQQIASIKKKAASPEATPQDKERLERCFTPVLFFREILKRGKTASIVATYGKRLNIDGFSIFQGVRGYACPNADQIINGVKTWWRHLAPEYLNNLNEDSPFPLNLVITWWATQLNYATNPEDSKIYEVIDSIVSNLGIIRDPTIATTFALHDHRSPDRQNAEIKLDFSPGSQRYRNLLAEPAFKHQFARDVSRQSFDAMITDTLTGGAEFFFQQARAQMEALRQREDGRLARIRNQMEKAGHGLLDALAWPDLIPQPKPRDTRKEHLEAFLTRVREIPPTDDEEALRRLNRFLRELVNIQPGDLPGLPESGKASPAFIERAFDTWVAEQSQRIEADPRFADEATSLELADGESLRTFLRALVDSLRPDHEKIAHWLRERLSLGSPASAVQLRRLLAIRMGNALVYGPTGPQTSREDPLARRAAMTAKEGNQPSPPPLRYFLDPLVGRGGRIETLAQREVQPRKRPDLPGDPQIREIFESAPSSQDTATPAQDRS